MIGSYMTTGNGGGGGASASSGGWFSNFYQNVASTITTAQKQEEAESKSWFPKFWDDVAQAASTIITTFDQLQKEQDTTPVYTPPYFPPWWSQSEMPPGGTVWSYDQGWQSPHVETKTGGQIPTAVLAAGAVFVLLIVLK